MPSNMAEVELLSVVALLADLLEQGLVRGQVGTVVEVLAPGVYEVDFCDGDGRTYATVALNADQLLRLHHQPVGHAGILKYELRQLVTG